MTTQSGLKGGKRFKTRARLKKRAAQAAALFFTLSSQQARTDASTSVSNMQGGVILNVFKVY